MDKNDNVQAPTSTVESSATSAQLPSAQAVTSPSASGANTAGTPSTALGNPDFLQNVQQRFDSMGDDAGSFLVGSLPPEVVRRVNALRNLQVEHHKIEAKFFEEVHALECRYLNKYQPLYEKRVNIVKGIYEPTDAEAKCAFDEDEHDEEAKKAETGEKTDEQKKEEGMMMD
ncbi:unnamed protein product [Rotaria sp. Silwood1]|nr:unnamed protein product [Rotaria sp. Silwood1]CAF4674716.1 unnamed protein product [Rotaria sp. Silwood1]